MINEQSIISNEKPKVSKRKKSDSNHGELLKIQKAFQPQLLYGDQLKQALRQAKLLKIKELNEFIKAKNPHAREVTHLTTTQVAELFINTKLVKFILFDNQENGRVAMYQPKEGIYTTNYLEVYKVISFVEKSFNERESNEVIFHLKKDVEIIERTKDRNLIAVNNGVFNCKTKELEPFSPDYVFTTKISTDYKKNPTKPKWDIDEWINSIAANDNEIATLLWQLINESLNGNYTRGKAFFLVGEGNNGKGTFQELISNLIGKDNIQAIKVDEFEQRFITSTMEGKSLILGDDVSPNVYVDNSSVFKSIVTGDPILIEYKNKQPFTAQLTPTIIQSTNGMPRLRDKTHGMLRRLKIVPFNANFNGSVEDKTIKEVYVKSKEVLEYVLNKAIHMEFDDFINPTASQRAMNEYRQENDPVVEFVENVFKHWKSERIPKRFVFEGYKQFCNVYGYQPLSNIKFQRELKKHIGDDFVEKTQKVTLTENNNLVDDSNNQDFTFNVPSFDTTKAHKVYEKSY